MRATVIPGKEETADLQDSLVPPHEQAEGGRLREFQERLLNRMSAACEEGRTHESRLGVYVAGQACLVDLREIDEIVLPMPITPVPLTRDWYLGLANVRGNLISVVDLDLFCGAPSQAPGSESRVIVLRAVHAGHCGFLVSSVLGLRDLQEMTACKSAEPGLGQWPFMQAYADRNSAIWREISFAALIDDARFLHVAL